MSNFDIAILENLKNFSYVSNNLETRIMPRKAVMESERNYVYININNQCFDFDWVVTFVIRLPDDSCVIVTTDLVSHYMPWLASPGSLWDIWLRSTPDNLVCEPVDNFLGFETQSASTLYVVTYDTHEGGGGVFLHPAMQAKLHDIFPDGYFLILSSRHESIACPKNIGPTESVFEIFTELNNNESITPIQDKITDDLYFCDRPYHLGKVAV